MSRVLFLTERMCRGYGVDLVVSNVSQQLQRLGFSVTIGCREYDGEYRTENVVHVDATPAAVQGLVDDIEPAVVVAHTSPFFETLPQLHSAPCWAWEHGDPTPEFFSEDGDIRRQIVENKQVNCYPHIDGVIAISEFIKSDIGFPGAKVIYNGCDHVPDMGTKNLDDFALDKKKPIRVGTLMRMGVGEARYKGNDLFLQLHDLARGSGLNVEFQVMGRGSERDAAFFRDRGIRVHLNTPDKEKFDYLRQLDVFMSCSLWEGFNLPLIEAQALGTVALAFDTGAHPETTPMVLSHPLEGLEMLRAYCDRNDLLSSHSALGYHFVRRRFRWADTARLFASTVGAAPQQSPRGHDGNSEINMETAERTRSWSGMNLLQKGILSLKRDGVATTAHKTLEFARKKRISRNRVR